MKLHQHFEFGPASQDPFSFCQIQLALITVYDTRGERSLGLFCCLILSGVYSTVRKSKKYSGHWLDCWGRPASCPAELERVNLVSMICTAMERFVPSNDFMATYASCGCYTCIFLYNNDFVKSYILL
jgi:hypothetical protein